MNIARSLDKRSCNDVNNQNNQNHQNNQNFQNHGNHQNHRDSRNQCVANRKMYQNILVRHGMAIPMVFGLIVVAGILGTTIWMSGRVGATRVKQSINILQLTNLTEAGITSGYSRLKQKAREGIDLDKINIKYFQIEMPLKYGKGICDGSVRGIGRGKYRITATGKLQPSKRRFASKKTMKLSAIAKIETTLITDPANSFKFLKEFRCSLVNIRNEEVDTK